MESRVENRIAFTFPVFKFERFAMEIPTRSDNSVNEIFRSAIIRSNRKIIAILSP